MQSEAEDEALTEGLTEAPEEDVAPEDLTKLTVLVFTVTKQGTGNESAEKDWQKMEL